MKQVLFTLFGVPMYGFGAMLFVCFVAVTVWGSRRAKRTADMPPERFQDMVIWLFVSGIVGARVLYMIQYAHQFPDKSPLALATAFVKIWEGGIIFYGSALGGVLGYGLFYYFVLRKLDVSGWKLADAVAPLLALGLAIGRIGCYLNGCCWGQVACEECRPVPLGAAHFPLLPAHSRAMLVGDLPAEKGSQYLQTATGFLRGAPSPLGRPVTGIEAGSPADRAGLKPGDVIVTVNGATNDVKPTGYDRLDELTWSWPRGETALALTVERDGQKVDLPPFVPETVGLYPTQLYETVSMVLLILVLLAYYPYRRHDGQVMVVLMVGYGLHRFINESLRIEPTIGAGLTLSQWGSVVISGAAVAIELYLWATMPSRWKGEAAASTPVAPQSPPL